MNDNQFQTTLFNPVDFATRMHLASLQLAASVWKQWFTMMTALASPLGRNTLGESMSWQEALAGSLTELGRKQTQAAVNAVQDATPVQAESEVVEPEQRAGTSAQAKRVSRPRSRTTAPAKRRSTRSTR